MNADDRPTGACAGRLALVLAAWTFCTVPGSVSADGPAKRDPTLIERENAKPGAKKL